MTEFRSPARLFLALAVLLVAGGMALSTAALASGSIGASSSGVTQYGQMYKQGKSVFFRKIACSRSECPVRRSEVNAGLAAGLVESLRTRHELKLEETKHDATVRLLCPGADARDCADRPDEQEMVLHYLSRRFGIGG